MLRSSVLRIFCGSRLPMKPWEVGGVGLEIHSRRNEYFGANPRYSRRFSRIFWREFPSGRPNAAYRVREHLTEDEMARLLAALKRKRHGQRDWLIGLLIYRHRPLPCPATEGPRGPRRPTPRRRLRGRGAAGAASTAQASEAQEARTARHAKTH